MNVAKTNVMKNGHGKFEDLLRF